MDGIAIASLATDGGDGPTDAAGAIVTSAIVRNAHRAGMDPAASLLRNDAYTLFKQVGGLFRPGPTGTNVNDLIIAVIE